MRGAGWESGGGKWRGHIWVYVLHFKVANQDTHFEYHTLLATPMEVPFVSRSVTQRGTLRWKYGETNLERENTPWATSTQTCPHYFPFLWVGPFISPESKSNQQCFLHRRQPCDMKRRHQPWCWMLEGTSASSVCHLWDGSWVRWICYECRMTEWASTEICENFPSWPTLRLSVSVTQLRFFDSSRV